MTASFADSQLHPQLLWPDQTTTASGDDLAQRLWDRYVAAPGVIPQNGAQGLAQRLYRRLEQPLPLLADLQARWLPSAEAAVPTDGSGLPLVEPLTTADNRTGTPSSLAADFTAEAHTASGAVQPLSARPNATAIAATNMPAALQSARTRLYTPNVTGQNAPAAIQRITQAFTEAFDRRPDEVLPDVDHAVGGQTVTQAVADRPLDSTPAGLPPRRDQTPAAMVTVPATSSRREPAPAHDSQGSSSLLSPAFQPETTVVEAMPPIRRVKRRGAPQVEMALMPETDSALPSAPMPAPLPVSKSAPDTPGGVTALYAQPSALASTAQSVQHPAADTAAVQPFTTPGILRTVEGASNSAPGINMPLLREVTTGEASTMKPSVALSLFKSAILAEQTHSEPLPSVAHQQRVAPVQATAERTPGLASVGDSPHSLMMTSAGQPSPALTTTNPRGTATVSSQWASGELTEPIRQRADALSPGKQSVQRTASSQASWAAPPMAAPRTPPNSGSEPNYHQLAPSAEARTSGAGSADSVPTVFQGEHYSQSQPIGMPAMAMPLAPATAHDPLATPGTGASRPATAGVASVWESDASPAPSRPVASTLAAPTVFPSLVAQSVQRMAAASPHPPSTAPDMVLMSATTPTMPAVEEDNRTRQLQRTVDTATNTATNTATVVRLTPAVSGIQMANDADLPVVGLRSARLQPRNSTQIGRNGHTRQATSPAPRSAVERHGEFPLVLTAPAEQSAPAAAQPPGQADAFSAAPGNTLGAVQTVPPAVPADNLRTSASAETNPDELVDKVLRKLLRRLAIEGERKGVRQWP